MRLQDNAQSIEHAIVLSQMSSLQSIYRTLDYDENIDGEANMSSTDLPISERLNMLEHRVAH